MPIEQVEELIEVHYATVQLSREQELRVRSQVTSDLGARSNNLVAEKQQAATHREKLLNERAKLLQAHYAGAIPIDLLKSEQDRIGQELAHAERLLRNSSARLSEALANLDAVLQLVGDCQRAYVSADEKVRRLFNQAFFEAIYVKDDETVTSKLAQPFELLIQWSASPAEAASATEIDPLQPPTPIWSETDNELLALLRNKKRPATSLEVAGSQKNYLVDLLGRYSKFPPLPSFPRSGRTARGTSRSVKTTPENPKKRHKAVQRLSPEERTVLLEAYASGTPSTVLMQQFGLGKGTVLKILADAGVVRPQVSPSSEQIDEAAGLYADGWSTARIGERLGFSSETIRQHLKRKGVQMRRPWK